MQTPPPVKKVFKGAANDRTSPTVRDFFPMGGKENVMASKRKKPGGTVGQGGVGPAPRDQDLTVRVAAEQLVMMPLSDLVPYANNA